jgi:Rrf2 family nitric oxide-sensitive transcriptional repressor
MHLAIKPGRKVSIASIAETYDISRNHLMKVSQNLARLGYVIGYRGKGGGIALARPARNINLGHLVQQIERNLHPADGIVPGQPSQDIPLFDQAVEYARSAYIETLSKFTLADLVDDAEGKRPAIVQMFTAEPLEGSCGPNQA